MPNQAREMNCYFILTECNRFNHPIIELRSNQISPFYGEFIIDHMIPLNLIKKSQILSTIPINRSAPFYSRQFTINRGGDVTITFHDYSFEFGIIDYEGGPGITGISGAQFLDKLLEANYFCQVARSYERIFDRIEASKRVRITRRIARCLRNQ